METVSKDDWKQKQGQLWYDTYEYFSPDYWGDVVEAAFEDRLIILDKPEKDEYAELNFEEDVE